MKLPMLCLLGIAAFSNLTAQDRLPRPSVFVVTPYPRLALLARVTGDVTMVVQVTSGVPKVIRVESGHQLLRESAVRTVERWRYAVTENSSGFPVNLHYEIVGMCPHYGCETELEIREGVTIFRSPAHRPLID